MSFQEIESLNHCGFQVGYLPEFRQKQIKHTFCIGLSSNFGPQVCVDCGQYNVAFPVDSGDFAIMDKDVVFIVKRVSVFETTGGVGGSLTYMSNK